MNFFRTQIKSILLVLLANSFDEAALITIFLLSIFILRGFPYIGNFIADSIPA